MGEYLLSRFRWLNIWFKEFVIEACKTYITGIVSFILISFKYYGRENESFVVATQDNGR